MTRILREIQAFMGLAPLGRGVSAVHEGPFAIPEPHAESARALRRTAYWRRDTACRPIKKN
jgi:hypothetical protein